MKGETTTVPTVRNLRQRWKPHKERLAALGGEQPTSIRFQRACSWMARVEQMADGQDHDLGLVSLRIAFNSLYGQWDCQKREPKPDRESWRVFIDRILQLDRDGYVPAVLQEHKRLVMALFDDEYVSAYFWQEPTAERGRRARRSAINAQSWYVEQRHPDPHEAGGSTLDFSPPWPLQKRTPRTAYQSGRGARRKTSSPFTAPLPRATERRSAGSTSAGSSRPPS